MHERLAAFLLRIARDAMGFGVIEDHVGVVEQAHPHSGERATHDPRLAVVNLEEWALAMAKRLVPRIPTADGPGAEIEPYRVEWRHDLTCRWLVLQPHQTYVGAMEACRSGIRKHGGQCRIVVQHVSYVEGLGSGVPLP